MAGFGRRPGRWSGRLDLARRPGRQGPHLRRGRHRLLLDRQHPRPADRGVHVAVRPRRRAGLRPAAGLSGRRQRAVVLDGSTVVALSVADLLP